MSETINKILTELIEYIETKIRFWSFGSYAYEDQMLWFIAKI